MKFMFREKKTTRMLIYSATFNLFSISEPGLSPQSPVTTKKNTGVISTGVTISGII